MVDVFEEVVDAGSEGHDCGVDGQVVPPVVEVVGDHLQAEVGHGVEALLGQEDGADALGPLEVAKLEGDELLEPVEVTVYRSVVPPCGDHELNADVDVVIGAGELEQFIVELVEVFAAVLGVEQEFAIGELAGVGEDPDVLEGPAEDEEAHADVIREHDLHEPVEELLVLGLQEGLGLEFLVGRVERLEVLVGEVLAQDGLVGLEDEHLPTRVLYVLVDVFQDCHEVAALPRVLLCHLLQRLQERDQLVLSIVGFTLICPMKQSAVLVGFSLSVGSRMVLSTSAPLKSY